MSAPTLVSPAQQTAVRELAALTVAFSWATMHRLRDEPGVAGRPELAGLLPPSIVAAYSSKPALSTLPEGGVEHSSASEPERAQAALNIPEENVVEQGAKGAPPQNLPLFIVRAMHAALLQSSAGEAKIDPAAYSTALGAMQQFTDQLTALERIRDSELSTSLRPSHPRLRTPPHRQQELRLTRFHSPHAAPIPMVLQIHLQLLLLVFVASVPLQLVGSLGFFSIPCTAIAAIVSLHSQTAQ